jgi:hypothetical protein
MTSVRFPLIAALTFALIVTGSSLAAAQAAGTQEQPAEAAPSPTQRDLKTYAVARLEVLKVSKSYRPQIEAAKSPDEAKAVQQEAMQEMVKVVQNNGLSDEKYNEITGTMQNNPEVAQQVEGYIAEAE